MSPFSCLLDIASRSRSHAVDLPQQVELTTYWRGVGFMLAGQNFASRMEDVSEILQPPRLTKVPGVRSWVLGIANVRGRLVPVIDLAGLLGLPSQASWLSRRVIVLAYEEHFIGLLVDAVMGMQQFAEDRQIDAFDLHPEFHKFVEHAYELDGKSWPVFKLTQLLYEPEFLQIAV